MYQRQRYHKKGDKYFLQPILVQSFRASKKQLWGFAEKMGASKEKFMERWEATKTDINRPRHEQLYRFPSFPSCAYVHYDEPQYIEQRLHYWEMLDVFFDRHALLSSIPDDDRLKILEEIDSILPRPSRRLLEILENAYHHGMPRDPSPKEQYEKG